ncbi:hypothetical protein BGZ83_010305 [Gryganskiella cystojenkinii]|nr:hypothetical protein BGZ83_010305 [Gryganskiella cystojenkinii]
MTLPHADFAIKDFETLIGALPALTDLSLDSTNFDDHCFQILKNVDQGRYGTTLTELSIKHCENFSGRFIHEVLCNFAALQVFKADTLFYSDLLQDEREHGGQRRPWVCLGLKTLSLFFKRISDPHTASSENVAPAVPSDGTSVVNNTVETTSTPATTTSMITSTSPTFESLLFPRVATLEQLETLDMANYQSLRPPEIIRLDLEHGLDQLKTLKRLRVLKGFNSFRNQVAHWDEAEAHWVLKHWPRPELREIATATSHIQLFFVDDTDVADEEVHRHFAATINVKSKDEDSRLVFWHDQNFNHPIISELEDLPEQRFYPIPNSEFPSLEGLDFVRTRDLIPNFPEGGQLLVPDLPRHDNAIIDKLKPILNRAIDDRAIIYLYGSQFSHSRVHEVHMNQGSLPNFENGVHQDGAIIVQYEDHWEAVFLAFGSQRLPTDKFTGLPTADSMSLAVLCSK